MTDLTERPTMTVDEAAELAGVGRNQAYSAVREGIFPSLRIGKRILIPRKKLMRILNGDDDDE